MAWKETHVMDERMKFVADWLSEEVSLAELCRWYGVSRKTGYKLICRYQAEGPAGLMDRSRAPHCHPNAIDDEREAAILGLREEHPTWGAKKLKRHLEDAYCDKHWPARSTIAGMLDRHGSGAAAKAAPSWCVASFAAGEGRGVEPGL